MKTELYRLKTRFLNFLVSEQMFHTLSIFGCIELSFSDSVPIAGISCRNNIFRTYLNKVVLTYDDVTVLFVLLHEIRHLYQIANIDEMLTQINWTYPNIDKETKFKIFNLAADIALNQDVAKMLTKQFKFASAQDLVNHVRSVIGGGCFVDELKKLCEEKEIECLEERDVVYYAHKILDINNDSLQSFDSHLFDEADSDALKEAAKQAVEKATQEAARLSRAAGVSSSDEVTTLTGKYNTTTKIKAFLKALKIKAGVLGAKSWVTKKTWNKKNRKRDNVPGFKRIANPVPGVVLILDTSGSMYQEDMLKGLAAVGQELVKQNKLAAAYCCDTELSPLTFGNAVAMRGGGGTILDNEHMDQIMKEHGAERLSVIYVTDECVDLTEVKNNPLVTLMVINLPEELRLK